MEREKTSYFSNFLRIKRLRACVRLFLNWNTKGSQRNRQEFFIFFLFLLSSSPPRREETKIVQCRERLPDVLIGTARAAFRSLRD